ncbi:hypothetical protein HanRHA438_Chr16g0752131 [Helianthus annuus]|nr:hypothetical protein HanRHA438_Chr16g0752131 [Helianthus annuus]
MSSENSGTSSVHSRNSRRGRRPSIEATLVHYVMALREALDEMTSVEEVLIDRINYLTVGLENSFQEINLLHQRLNILVKPPMEPVLPQEDWNLALGVNNPTGWDDIPAEPPLENLQEVSVEVAPPQTDANEPSFLLPREIEEWLADI